MSAACESARPLRRSSPAQSCRASQSALRLLVDPRELPMPTQTRNADEKQSLRTSSRGQWAGSHTLSTMSGHHSAKENGSGVGQEQNPATEGSIGCIPASRRAIRAPRVVPLQPLDGRGRGCIVVLIVERQVADLDHLEREVRRRELGSYSRESRRLRQPSNYPLKHASQIPLYYSERLTRTMTF